MFKKYPQVRVHKRSGRRYELRARNASRAGIYADKSRLDLAVRRIGAALKDDKLSRSCLIDIYPNQGDSELWVINLASSFGKGEIELEVDSLTGRVNTAKANPPIPDKCPMSSKPIMDQATMRNAGGPIPLERVDSSGNVSFEYRYLVDEARFLSWITKAASRFLDEYGAYNQAKDSDVNRKGGFRSSEVDYDLRRWSDRVKGDLENLLIPIERDFFIELEDVSTSENKAKGRIVLQGEYKDLDGIVHTLEIRVFWEQGELFKVWIRPDMKGSALLKDSKTKDLSMISKWIKSNVKEDRGIQESYIKEAISFKWLSDKIETSLEDAGWDILSEGRARTIIASKGNKDLEITISRNLEVAAHVNGDPQFRFSFEPEDEAGLSGGKIAELIEQL